MLPSAARSCHFCDSPAAGDSWQVNEPLLIPSRGNLALSPNIQPASKPISLDSPLVDSSRDSVPAWQHELAQKLESYRGRRRRVHPSPAQTQFSFSGELEQPLVATADAHSELGTQAAHDFSFTIAIGRSPKRPPDEKPQLVIDLSAQTLNNGIEASIPERPDPGPDFSLCPIASIDDRRIAALLDSAFLLFAYGGFLTLFGSLGGQFTLSKLSVVVYALSLVIIYTQYFALFTIIGDTTPGMMLRSLQVVSFSGEAPSPRQMVLRSFGYLISAATFGLGYLWALWDEDGLTWHDRLSETYLTSQQEFASSEPSAWFHSN